VLGPIGATVTAYGVGAEGPTISVLPGTSSAAEALVRATFEKVNPGTGVTIDEEPYGLVMSPIIGGDSMSNDNDQLCTASYTGRVQAFGQYAWYKLIAGHCALVNQPPYRHGSNPSNPTYPYETNLFSYNGTVADDVALLIGTTTTATPPTDASNYKVRYESTQKTISSDEDLTTFAAGSSSLCMYGAESSQFNTNKSTCGSFTQIYNPTVCAPASITSGGCPTGSVPVNYFYQLRVQNLGGGWGSCEGDSGGPVYGLYGNGSVSAMGTVVGGTGTFVEDPNGNLCTTGNLIVSQEQLALNGFSPMVIMK
jgi:hypothetical protein